MAFVVENDDFPAADAAATYEQPLNERMRTFLRLEFLYKQTLYHADADSEVETRKAIDGLLEIGAILSRGDVRSEVLKELERQIDQFQAFASKPGVDATRVDDIIDSLMHIRSKINDIGPHYLQDLKDCEFLSAIKHRSAIPGGTCEFDLPVFGYWLRQPFDVRRADLQKWLTNLRPLCEGVNRIMWLVRESAIPADFVADNGMYQHSIGKDITCRLLRVTINSRQNLYPEISGSPQRFTIRFLQWLSVDQRAAQTSEDVSFSLSIC